MEVVPMAKDSGYVLKLSLNEEEKDQLTQLVRAVSDELGIEVTMSWLIRTLVRLTLKAPERTSPAESHILLRMYTSAECSDIDTKFQLR
jgi:hypothetical protein